MHEANAVKRRKSWTPPLRYLSQGAFAAIIVVNSLRHHLISEQFYPPVDALCPFGGIETLHRFVSQGLYLSKTEISDFILLGAILLGAVLAGGSFCGWICPMGALQDLLTGIRRRLRLPALEVSAAVHRPLTYLRYIVLAWVVYATVATARLVFADYDPFRTLFSLSWVFEFDPAKWIAYAVVAVTLVGALFIPRFWCRYACPLGAIISLAHRISPFKVERDPRLCIDCGRCAKACPVKLPVDQAIRIGASCTGCLDCVEACPKAGALEVKFFLPNPGRTAPKAKEQSA